MLKELIRIENEAQLLEIFGKPTTFSMPVERQLWVVRVEESKERPYQT